MNPREAIRINLDLAEFVCQGYLADLSDGDLFVRPSPGSNHINWQIGHLVASEHRHLGQIEASAPPPLPAGFALRYTKETAALDDPARFVTKVELLALHQVQRDAALALLERQSDADLDRPTSIPYAPTVGAIFSLLGSHWLMHSGQWVVTRRLLGRPPLY